MVKRCVTYARISVTAEESVSVARQQESARKYAEARGWQVVGEYVDDGVSATKKRPEERAGWAALLAAPEQYDFVVIWKVDRLSRRTLDFLNADATLKQRKAAIVAVADSIDMDSTAGRGFATIQSVFSEMEASAISDRVKAARRVLLHDGRVAGGSVPYGWRNVKNPHGKGMVLAHDPKRIEFVRDMVSRAQRGDTIYSIVKWLDEAGAPLPTKRASAWSYSTVERLLRNPVLAGMTPYNPNNTTKVRGDDVVRGADGLPVVGPAAIMPVAEWRALVRKLDQRDSGHTKPVALRAKTSGLLSGLVWCGEHCDPDTRMHRGVRQGREVYVCPVCYQTITNFETVLIEHFLTQKGEHVRWSVVEEIHEGGAALLPEIENRLSELTAKLRTTDDDDEAEKLTEQIADMRTMRREARAKAPTVTYKPVRDATLTFSEDWERAETVEERREILDDAIARIWIIRGGTGRRTPESTLARLVIEWKDPDHLGPLDRPDDETLARWADEK